MKKSLIFFDEILTILKQEQSSDNALINEVKLLKCQAYRLNGDFEKAWDVLNHIDIVSNGYKLEKAKLHLSKKDYNRAVLPLNDLIYAEGMEDPEIYCLRGQVYLNRKTKLNDAIKDFNKALELSPNFPLAQEGLRQAQQIKANKSTSNKPDFSNFV